MENIGPEKFNHRFWEFKEEKTFSNNYTFKVHSIFDLNSTLHLLTVLYKYFKNIACKIDNLFHCDICKV